MQQLFNLLSMMLDITQAGSNGACILYQNKTLFKRYHHSIISVSDHEAKNSAISEAFIRFFVETVGHYSYHFTPTYDGSQKFDREGFIKAVSSKSVRTFLEVFSETQMFSLFIQEKEAESEGISQGQRWNRFLKTTPPLKNENKMDMNNSST